MLNKDSTIFENLLKSFVSLCVLCGEKKLVVKNYDR